MGEEGAVEGTEKAISTNRRGPLRQLLKPSVSGAEQLGLIRKRLASLDDFQLKGSTGPAGKGCVEDDTW